jgi:hypothetical protein
MKELITYLNLHHSSIFLHFEMKTKEPFCVFQTPPEVIRENLVGSIEDVKFDDTPVGLWNFADGENNKVGEFAR